MKNDLIIHCIGDSHASVFSGTDRIRPIWPERSTDHIPTFKTYRLGPVTAYNLSKLGSSTQGREKLFEVLKSLPRGSNVMFCFGEIDCRVHLLKQALLQKRGLEQVVKECVERYFSVVLEAKSMGFNILVFGAVPSTKDGKIVEPDYVAFGTCQERNKATSFFNQHLKKLTDECNINFISVFDELTNPDGLTNFYYYSDRIHLSQKTMPLIIKKIYGVFPDIKVSLFKNKILNKLPDKIRNILFYMVSYLRAYEYKLEKNNNLVKEKILKLINKVKFFY